MFTLAATPGRPAPEFFFSPFRGDGGAVAAERGKENHQRADPM